MLINKKYTRHGKHWIYYFTKCSKVEYNALNNKVKSRSIMGTGG